MKKIIPLSILLICYTTSFSQVPGKFNYQAVIRDASGHLRSEVDVAIQILISQGSVTSNPIYIENHNVRTNSIGLVNLALGSGAVDLGTFNNINWAQGPYFVKVKINGVDYGSSEILSVPYALYADKAGNGFSGNYNDLTNLPVLFDGTWTSLTGKPSFATVATSGSYNDILNKPSLFSGSYNDLTNKPVLNDGTWISLTGKPTTLSGYGIADAMNISHAANDITTTNITNWNAALGWGNHIGLYRPITYVPTWAEVTDKPAFAAIATSGTFADLLSKPTTLTGYGITNAMSTTHPANAITSTNISNWTTAYGWGNHAMAGYQPLITAGTATQYLRGDKTWQILDKIAVGLGNVENIRLSTWLGSANLSTLGTITSGIWNAGAVTSTGAVTANSFIKLGGTSSQFLKADGSIDANNYITAVREVTDEFNATSGQSGFTLTQTPSVTSKAKMYINGVRISNTAYSTTGNIVIYLPSNNGSYTLTAGDRIQFDYSY